MDFANRLFFAIADYADLDDCALLADLFLLSNSVSSVFQGDDHRGQLDPLIYDVSDR